MELIIPYFTFRDIPAENSLLLRIFIDKVQFEDVHFQIEENSVSVYSSKYEKRCIAKIRLPAKFMKTNSEISFDDGSHSSLRCYSLRLQKSECNSSLENNLMSNLDVISQFLSWNSESQEEPVILSAYESEFDNDISKALLKKLTLKDSFSNRSEETKIRLGFYGFASRYKNELMNSEVNWRNIIDCDNPDSSDNETRHHDRWENERQSFDIDHYLADFFFEKTEDEVCDKTWLNQCINYNPYWESIHSPDEKILTPKQMTLLAGLSCKDFQLSVTERLEVLNSLFDIILAYVYDIRLNGGVHNSESSWNIGQLSSTLSWFLVYKHPRDVILSFFRRSLTFPLVRHLVLSRKVLRDTLVIFNLGRRQLLNCLVSIFELFDDDDDRRIFNKLYIEDYLIWIQQVHPQTIKNYAEFIKSCNVVRKEDVFSTLRSIESAAIEMLREEDEFQYEEWRRNLNEVKSLAYEKKCCNVDSDKSSESETSGSETS